MKQLEKGASFPKLYNFVRQDHNNIISNTDYSESNTRLRYGTLPMMTSQPTVRQGGIEHTIRSIENYIGPWALAFETSMDEPNKAKIIVNAGPTSQAGYDARIYAGTNEVEMYPDAPVELVIDYPFTSWDDRITASVRVAIYDAETMQIASGPWVPDNFKVYWDIFFGYGSFPSPSRMVFVKPLGEVKFNEYGYLDRLYQWWHSGWIYVEGRIV